MSIRSIDQIEGTARIASRMRKADPVGKKAEICILSFSDISWDSRVLRQIEYASREYHVDVIGYGDWTPPRTGRVAFHSLTNKGFKLRERLLRMFFLGMGRVWSRWWIQAYWMGSDYRKAYELLKAGGYSIIHANDLEALPMAALAGEKTGARVLFDAHEYSPGQVLNVGRGKRLKVAYVSFLLRKFTCRADDFVTVCEGLASLYREKFGLEAEVIMNAASRSDSNSEPVDRDRVKLIHHGAAKPARKLEQMIELVRMLDERYCLYFMLIGQSEYLMKLKKLAAELAPGRLFFKDAVPPHKVVSQLSQFDMSLCLIPPMPVSYKYALPNKFFESLAAGLAIVTGPSPEMARLTEKHGFGVIAQGFEIGDLAKVLNSLNHEQINDMKLKAVAAGEILNADVEMGKLLKIYRRLIG